MGDGEGRRADFDGEVSRKCRAEASASARTPAGHVLIM
jgi:hypothetical protein